jgi:hypothetical protein
MKMEQSHTKMGLVHDLRIFLTIALYQELMKRKHICWKFIILAIGHLFVTGTHNLIQYYLSKQHVCNQQVKQS